MDYASSIWIRPLKYCTVLCRILMKKIHFVGSVLVTATLTWLLLVSVLFTWEAGHPTQTRQYLDQQRTFQISIRRTRSVHNSSTLLTLFTTFKEKEERDPIYKLTIQNWASLQPQVQPILYVSTRQVALGKMAEDYGWTVLQTPRVNEHGTPFLKEMYLEAFRTKTSLFYAYANGDILFEKGLLQNLEFLSQLQNVSQLFVTGRRTDYEFEPSNTCPNVQESQNVRTLGQKGILDTAKALDYFIMTNSGFHWDEVPDLVIGRIGYDNFLAAKAVSWQMITVDATQTLPAVHLHGSNFTMTHSSDNDADSRWNIHQIGKFKYVKGFINKLRFETYWTSGREIDIRKRLTFTEIRRAAQKKLSKV